MPTILACILLSLALNAVGTAMPPVQSQPPPPSPTVHGEGPQDNPERDKSSPGAHSQSTQANPVTVNVFPSPNTQPAANHDAENHDKEPTTEWGMVIPTWILAIATTGLFFFTFKLWGSTRTLVTDAKDTAERQLRAYVWVDVNLDLTSETIDGYSTQLQISNGGQTPAYDVRCWIRLRCYPTPLAEGFSFEKAPDEMAGPRFVINPSGLHIWAVTTDSPAGTVKLSITKQGVFAGLYAFGEVRYVDAFGEAHTTRFRMLRTIIEGTSNYIWQYCDEGNDADQRERTKRRKSSLPTWSWRRAPKQPTAT